MINKTAQPVTVIMKRLLALCLLTCFQAYAEPLSLGLDLKEGGRLTPKAVSQFERYMALQDCELKIETDSQKISKSDLYFSALDLPPLLPSHNKVLSASILNNEPLTITILVKSSTGISDLSSLQGERLAIISYISHVGGIKATTLLTASGLDLNKGKIYQTGNYLGAMSLLLHGDVFMAAIPGPLARQWLKHNELTIIAESEPTETGGLFIKPLIGQARKASCITAFKSLKKEHRRDKKMVIFPSWLTGFKLINHTESL